MRKFIANIAFRHSNPPLRKISLTPYNGCVIRTSYTSLKYEYNLNNAVDNWFYYVYHPTESK